MSFSKFARQAALAKWAVMFLILAGFCTALPAVQSVTVGWTASPDSTVTGYYYYYGPVSGYYTNKADVGNVTRATIGGLAEGGTYYIAVTAYDGTGVESDFSNEVSYAVPVTNAPPTIALTAPADGASYTAPATITLTAAVTANGHTVTTVQFYNGATLLGEAAADPYTITWTGADIGSYSLSARLVYDAGSTIDSAPVNVTVAGLSAPWQTADVGSVAAVGSASSTGGLYTVQGAGNLSGMADNFRFVYQALSGDGQIQARINSADNTGSNGRIGVMIRETLTTGSKCAFMGWAPDGRFCWQTRSQTSGSLGLTASGTGVLPNTWVRLVRSGNRLYGYTSLDGITWTQVASRKIFMATNIEVGLAVASGDPTVLNTSTFSDVTVVP